MSPNVVTDVRELLHRAENFLHGGDPYGAVSRAKDAARQAAKISSEDGGEIRQVVGLALERYQAAEEAAREAVNRRSGLHVTNERRATGMVDDVLETRPARRSRLSELVSWAADRRPRHARPAHGARSASTVG